MNLTKWTASAALALCGVASQAVQAAQAAPDGVMTFPHVNVVARQAPPSHPAAPPGGGGFMAYKDPLTGRLGNPTAEQAAALTGASRPPAPIARPRAAVRHVARPPHGGLSIMLDESFDRYAIARKGADGAVTETCESRGEPR